MTGKTNAGSGGGNCIAMIRVLYKVGTVASCTNGQFSFMSDMSGDYLFRLPVTGTWTVSGKDNKSQDKTVTLTVARGDAKMVTLDTMIPPAYRTTYREVEYIQVSDTDYFGKKPNLPLEVPIVQGSWTFELEKLWLKNPPIQYAEALNAGGLALSCPTQYIQLGEPTSAGTMAATKVITTETNLDYIIHWSSDSTESKPISLTVGGEELYSDTSAAGLAYAYPLYAFGNTGTWAAAWPGKYGAIKATKDGVLLHHFIPSKRISDGMPGYFDLLTNEFKQGYQNTDGTITKVLEVITCGPEIGT